MIKDQIRAAIQQMIEAGEFEKIANLHKDTGHLVDARAVIRLKNSLKMAEQIPIIQLLYMINDPEVWRDIVVFMISDPDTGDLIDEANGNKTVTDPDAGRPDIMQAAEKIRARIDELEGILSNPANTSQVGLSPYFRCQVTTFREALKIMGVSE